MTREIKKIEVINYINLIIELLPIINNSEKRLSSSSLEALIRICIDIYNFIDE